MARHDTRGDNGRFTKVNPETDVVAPGAGVPTDFAYDEVKRYAPASDVLAQGGEQHLAHRTPIEVDANTGQLLGVHVSDVSGLPGEIFGGTGTVRHDVAHGGYQRPLPHRSQRVINADTGEELMDVPDHILRAHVPDLRTEAHLAAAEGDPFTANLMGPAIGPETRSYRRTPGRDMPSMYDRDRDAEWRGGR